MPQLQLPPRRHRPALFLTWFFTVTSIVLAVGPNIRGHYDPQLAVYTATLIAVIWYTYFSYRSVNPYVRTIIRTTMTGQAHMDDVFLSPRISNESPNHVEARIIVEAWLDARQFMLDSFYSGAVPHSIEPHSTFTGAFTLSGPSFPASTKPPAPHNDPVPSYKHVRLRLTVFWHDQYDETGRAPPRHLLGQPAGNNVLQDIVTTPEISRWFGDLPSPPAAPPTPWE